ncbi:MAG: hypothetical protein V4727_09975 [Verrucomicrobiota bacterium]
MAKGTKKQGDHHDRSYSIQDSRWEMVLVGRYNEEPLSVTAAEAVKVFMEHSTGLGLQTLILRRIESSEITRSYLPTQIIGWRYHPDAHGKPPFCGCEFCQRGLIKNRKIREEYEANNQ